MLIVLNVSINSVNYVRIDMNVRTDQSYTFTFSLLTVWKKIWHGIVVIVKINKVYNTDLNLYVYFQITPNWICNKLFSYLYKK